MENKQSKIRTSRGTIMADKKICDMTYGKMVVECHFDKEKNQRYIKKSEVNMTNWANELGISRQTLSTRLKYLAKPEIGLVKEDGEYYIMPVATEHFFDVNEKTFRFLVNTCHKDSIRVYLFFIGWDRYCKKQKTKYQFSFDSLARELGWAERNAKTNQKIADIIELLERLGLLELEQEQVKVGKGMRYEVKTVNDTLPETQSSVISKRRKKSEAKPQSAVATKPAVAPISGEFVF